MNSLRIADGYEKRLEDFTNNILVVCPSCEKMALVVGSMQPQVQNCDIKLICSFCGFNKKLEDKSWIALTKSVNPVFGRYLIYGEAVDPFFHSPLWLTTNFDGNQLWAYNLEHLQFLEKIVGARLRERNIDDKQNKSLGSRLPRWMTSSKNREPILKAIKNLKSRI